MQVFAVDVSTKAPFRGNPAAQDVDFTIESSADLRTWLPDTTLELIDFDGSGNVIYSGMSSPGIRQFFRLQIGLE